MSGSEERKRAILEQALKDKELLAKVPAIVALAFGVLPIRKLGTVLTVACFGRANHDALRLLREVLELEIVATPFDDRQLLKALSEAYQADEEGTVNFPTFKDADFLVRPGTAAVLREQKIERVGEAGSSLPPELVVLAALTYRSCLYNLDAQTASPALPDRSRTKFELADEDLAWSLDARGEPTAWSREGEAPKAKTVLLVNEFRFSDHRNQAPQALHAEHSVRGAAIAADALPYVIHPTEIQLLRVQKDGSLVFHDYDHEERIAASAAPPAELPPARSFDCSYYFLSFGNCLRRTIEIVVHEVFPVERTRIAARSGKPGWSPRDLARWFAG